MWQEIFFLHSEIWGRIKELNKGQVLNWASRWRWQIQSSGYFRHLQSCKCTSAVHGIIKTRTRYRQHPLHGELVASGEWWVSFSATEAPADAIILCRDLHVCGIWSKKLSVGHGDTERILAFSARGGVLALQHGARLLAEWWWLMGRQRRTACSLLPIPASRLCSLREKLVKNYYSIFRCYLIKFVQS
jgi:hypothetical protein